MSEQDAVSKAIMHMKAYQARCNREDKLHADLRRSLNDNNVYRNALMVALAAFRQSELMIQQREELIAMIEVTLYDDQDSLPPMEQAS